MDLYDEGYKRVVDELNTVISACMMDRKEADGGVRRSSAVYVDSEILNNMASKLPSVIRTYTTKQLLHCKRAIHQIHSLGDSRLFILQAAVDGEFMLGTIEFLRASKFNEYHLGLTMNDLAENHLFILHKRFLIFSGDFGRVRTTEGYEGRPGEFEEIERPKELRDMVPVVVFKGTHVVHALFCSFTGGFHRHAVLRLPLGGDPPAWIVQGRGELCIQDPELASSLSLSRLPLIVANRECLDSVPVVTMKKRIIARWDGETLSLGQNYTPVNPDIGKSLITSVGDSCVEISSMNIGDFLSHGRDEFETRRFDIAGSQPMMSESLVDIISTDFRTVTCVFEGNYLFKPTHSVSSFRVESPEVHRMTEIYELDDPFTDCVILAGGERRELRFHTFVLFYSSASIKTMLLRSNPQKPAGEPYRLDLSHMDFEIVNTIRCLLYRSSTPSDLEPREAPPLFSALCYLGMERLGIQILVNLINRGEKDAFEQCLKVVVVEPNEEVVLHCSTNRITEFLLSKLDDRSVDPRIKEVVGRKMLEFYEPRRS